MATLMNIVQAEVEKYAGDGYGINLKLFPISDERRQIYSVIAVDYPHHQDIAGVVVLARIAEDKVVIEEDMADKKLIEALLQAGIPREQIILAYQGETVPELAPTA